MTVAIAAGRATRRQTKMSPIASMGFSLGSPSPVASGLASVQRPLYRTNINVP